MKIIHLLAAWAMMAATGASAQQSVFGARTPPPRSHHGGGRPHWGHHGFGGGIWIVERPFGYAQDREVPVIVERVVEVPVAAAAPTPGPSPEGEGKRKPYVVGQRYASLPGGCMKLIEGGASYYYCGDDEWYRAAGKQYLAVRKP